MCRELDERSNQARLKAPLHSSTPPILSGYTQLREFPPAATERPVAVSSSLLGQPEILLFLAEISQLLLVPCGSPTVALYPGRSQVARRLGSRPGTQRPGEGAGAFPARARPLGPFPEG